MITQNKQNKDYHYEPGTEILKRSAADIYNRDGIVKYPTGLKDLDEKIWGVHTKQLLVIAARPSHGKSAIIQNIAVNLAEHNHPVILLSLEMSRDAVMERLCCIKFELHNWHLRQGHEIEKKRFAEIELKMTRFLIDSPITVIDSMGRTIGEVEQVLEEWEGAKILVIHKQRNGPTGDVILDYNASSYKFKDRYSRPLANPGRAYIEQAVGAEK